MQKITHFRPKVGKLNFKDVAKVSGVSGTTTKKFKDQAFEALRKAGYGKFEAKSILGSRKLEHSSLRKVFNTLYKEGVIKKSGGVVKNFVEKEINKQKRMVFRHLQLRQEEIETEKRAEEATTKTQPRSGGSSKIQPTKKQSSANQSLPIAGGGFGPAQPTIQPDLGSSEQSFYSPQTNIRKSSDQGINSKAETNANNDQEQPSEPEDLMID